MVKPMPRLDLGLPGLFCLLILSGFSGLGLAPRRYSAIVRVSDASNHKQRNETMKIAQNGQVTVTDTNTYNTTVEYKTNDLRDAQNVATKMRRHNRVPSVHVAVLDQPDKYLFVTIILINN